MKEVLENFSKQCEEALKLGKGIKVKNISKILVSGIGGSAFAGDVLRAIVQEEADVSVNRDYSLSKNVDKNTLVFLVSYSGNTEETLYAIKDALRKKCQVIGVSSNGQLEKFCKTRKINFIKVPGGIQPRCAMGYLTLPMVNVLEENKLIKKKNFNPTLKSLKDKKVKEQGKKIANLLFKKIPLIYSSQKLECVSYGFKTRINENSKVLAFAHQFPELNHNELTGYTKKIANFFTIILQDKDDFGRIKKRFLITQKIIKKHGSQCVIIDTVGSDFISRIFSTLHLADWASYFLALKYKIDPEPVKIIEDLKAQMAR